MKRWILLCLLLLPAVAGCGHDQPNQAPTVPQPVAANNAAANASGNTPANPPSNTGPKPQPESEPAPVEQNKADYVAFEGGLRAYPAKHAVEMDAWLLGSQTRPLEYLLVMPGGNAHESLFATAVSGLHLKRALEIIGLQEGKIKRSGRGYLDKPLGDRVKLSVRFHHAKTGKLTTVPVEDWLWDHHTNSNPAPVGWIFTGSFEQYRQNLNRSLFEADMKGNIIAMWRDAACVLDNDRDDAYMTDIYSPYENADGIPKADRSMTPPVTLIFEPWPKDEPKDEKKEAKKD